MTRNHGAPGPDRSHTSQDDRVLSSMTESRRQEAERAVLLEITSGILGMLDVGTILDCVHRHTLRLLPCDRVLTYWWPPLRGAFELLAAHGVPMRLSADMRDRDIISAKLAEIWLDRGRPVMEGIIAARPGALLAWTDRVGATAFLSAPLNIGGGFGGVAVALREGSSGEFEPRSVQLFGRIAQQMATAMTAAERYSAKQEEAEFNGALAEVAHQLISGLNSSELLERLCQVTTRVLGCSRSYTALWEPKQNAYVPMASHGYSAEEWEALQIGRAHV